MTRPTLPRTSEKEHTGILPAQDRAQAERAHRIAGMLDRWESEDCSGEPEWDVDEIEPVGFRLASSDHDTP